MVKFVEPAEGGEPPKRKQVAHACEPCRKRKRRCTHHDVPVSRDKTPTSTDINLSSLRPDLATQIHDPLPTPTSTTSVSRQDENHNSRFVGDLNPESLLVEAVSPRSKRDSSNRDGVGVWVSRSTPPPPLMAQRGPESVVLPYAREHCLKVVPPPANFAALKCIFFEKIHPLFPVFDEVSLPPDDGSPASVLTKQAISLAAGTDRDAEKHLRLEESGPTLSHREFSNALSCAMRAIVESGMVSNRHTLIRCLSLLSLYIQPSSPEEADLPALIGCKAVFYGQTLALQLRSKTPQEDRETETLFLITWALDRMNSTFYGRPAFMHERDFGRNLDEAISRQTPIFRLLCIVIQILESVISLYRPGKESCGDEVFDLPVLEAKIMESGAAKAPSFLLATVETFYNAVTILSCRLPPPGAGRGTVPPPAASCRRSLAADRISFIVGTEFACRLSPFPIVPYGVSLALSVAYRKMRYTRVPMYWMRARASFAANCTLLQSLGDIFWSARALSSLGDRVLREMEKAMSSIAMTGEEVAGGGTGGGMVAQTNGAVEGQHDGEVAVNGTGNGTLAPAVEHTVNMAEASFFQSLPEMDLFGHLDPGFNLDAVDATLEANLDVGLQLDWPDWGNFVV